MGLSVIEEKLKGKTTVLMGPSGVGKSSLINAVRGGQNDADEDIMNKLLEQVFHPWLILLAQSRLSFPLKVSLVSTSVSKFRLSN